MTMSPLIDDLDIFLLAGRIKDPAAAMKEGEDAERLGFRRVWLSERYDLKEAGAMLGGVAARTSRLEVGTAAMAVGARHPLVAAALAATMQGMYGRFNLGLGRSEPVFLQNQNMSAAGYQQLIDYATIIRRLHRGETVTYDGPAGKFDGLRTVDVLEGEPPKIWSVILGGPKASRAAAAFADGVVLTPYITPEAVARSVQMIREECERLDRDPSIPIVAPVITAPEMEADDEVLITKARLVTYITWPAFDKAYTKLNEWDPAVIKSVQNHPQFANLDRSVVDQVFHRSELRSPSELIPDEWIESTCATGSLDACVSKLQEFKDAGADSIAFYGSTPADNAALVGAWRALRGAQIIGAR